MEPLESIIARHFEVCGGMLVVGGLPIDEITCRYGTPLFVYDAQILDRQWGNLSRALPQDWLVYYSVKANPNRTILRRFLERRCGLEVASGGEFYQAVRAGCPRDKIVFAGPGKTELELELVLRQGIGEIHVESVLEAKRISAISGRLGVRASVAVRINPGADGQGGAMRMGGKPAPFGIDEEMLESAAASIGSLQAVELRGLHLFSGTQILDHEILLHQYRKGLAIGRRLARVLGRPLRTVDFGGGLGIPYFANEQELDMAKLREGLSVLMAEAKRDEMLAEAQFVVEPGRYLVGEAGIYVTRVTDVKVSRGKRFIILDGGLNHHLAASGNLGQIIKKNFPVAVVNKLEDTATDVVELAGPLCTPLDTIGRDLRFPKVEVGDLIGVFQSGAYARSASPLGFLSHPTPAEVMVDGGTLVEIRRRGTYEDLCNDLVPGCLDSGN